MGRIEPRRVTLRDGRTVTVRTAEAEDAAEILAHARRTFGTSPFGITDPDEFDADYDEAKERDLIRELREHENSLVLVAEAEGRIVGDLFFKGARRRKLEHHGTFGLDMEPAWRGVGAGTALIEALLEWAREHPKIEKVCLGVVAENKQARRLYRRLGFVEEARIPRYFKFGPGRYADDVQMSIWVKGGDAASKQ